MDTLECARFLNGKGYIDAALDLYEKAVEEASNSDPFGNKSVVSAVVKAKTLFPEQKIAQIKYVREVFPQVGLRNAKELVEAINWNTLPC